MKRIFALLLFCISTHVAAESAHPLAGMRLILEGASCAGVEFPGDSRMLMYDEMECSRSGKPTLQARVRAISPNLLLAVEQAPGEVAPNRPPRTWIYAYGAVNEQQVILWESWTGWGDFPDEEVRYRVARATASDEPVFVIKSMVAGDIACYLTLTDADGERYENMADFEICERERELLGRQVVLTFEQGRVQAASCEGDPECSDSEVVSLVVGARLVQ